MVRADGIARTGCPAVISLHLSAEIGGIPGFEKKVHIRADAESALIYTVMTKVANAADKVNFAGGLHPILKRNA